LRRLGQHFLSDPKILERIVDALEPKRSDVVLEIGPGKGSLTRALLARGVKVIAIERDRELAAALDARENLTVITDDALALDWHQYDANKVIGNIPYYITSPLIDKALTPPLPERVVFLVQAEVADRMAAGPGTKVFLVQAEVADRIVAKPGGKTYGALSVGVQAIARVEKLFTVAPGAFRPPPTVRSALIRLKPLAEPLVKSEEVEAFRTFVTACFSKRRKQLKNAVPKISERQLRELDLDPTTRPERLPPTAFVRLLRAVQ